MLPRKPYFLRAMHQWIVDSDSTPYLVVDANVAGVEIPPGYAQDGKLVLNVSYSATDGLDIGSEHIEFNARFGGVSRHVRVPMVAVLAIYAHESGQGMLFDAEDGAENTLPGGSPKPAGESAGKKPTLKVIK
ncbi:MAG TPA: ClpXP protease specificity-enhancing factor [Gammaproteobacteria bacterium]|jgi:stringent starvation protein B|nr:ClpXP protease specificity-enhancing factor [Gammaproteobacteria bacterium]